MKIPLEVVMQMSLRYMLISYRSRVLLKKLLTAQLFKKFSAFMKPVSSLLFSQICQWILP
jgi:hypothetical protein